MHNKTGSLIAVALGAVFLQFHGIAATISGKVVDTANRPVASAYVTISEEPSSPSAPSAMRGMSAQTAPDGTFSFVNLAAGTYLLCSQVPHGTLIDPCQWATALPHASVASATATTSITLTMRIGYRIPIRVDDPQGWLDANEGKTPGAHLLIGVPGGYHFQEADIDSTDNGGRNVSVLVPLDTPVHVGFQSSFFKLQDATGKTLSATVPTPFTASSAAPAGSLYVKVVGRN